MPTVNDSVSGNNWPPVFPTHISICPSTDAAPFRVPLRPAPPQPVAVPRRQRKHSLPRIIAAARKAGADRVVVDGATIMLSPAAAVPVTEASTVADPDANEWDAVLSGGDHGPH
jgi:hypothetical protein